jgi:pimeloyl-ACP methyl ester carboxylesterase
MLRQATLGAALGVVVVAASCADDRDTESARLWEPGMVRSEPCPESRFECVTITVPRDHFGSDGETWEVTYAIQPAAVERRGTFVTITGGPGSAGIASADGYTDVMSSQITDYYDIVFLNQRGSGPFRPLRCDEAAADLYRAPIDVDSATAVDEIETVLETFVDDCMTEGDIDIGDLPYYATVQAAEDLEAVRRHLGVDTMTLYGESYGTQFVQTYAAAHPRRVEALILDGVVDLTVEGPDWYHGAARAYHDALTATFAACVADEACAGDADADDPDDLAGAYDALAARLDEAPIDYDFPMPDGSSVPRQLTAADLEIAASGNVGWFTGRMQLLRALNAAADGNYVPLDRLADQYVYVDPETQEVMSDPAWSDALYFAVECQDYSFFPGGTTPRARLVAWLDAFEAEGDDRLRLGGVALGDLPCLYWPSQPGTVERPDPITDPPYTTFVLTADTDPATPTVHAMSVFSRLDDAYFVTLQGGPHVIFDWGYSCVDDLISNYLGSGALPPTRVTICDGDVIDPYVSTEPGDDVAAFITDQLAYNVEYWLWPGDDTLEFGCDLGGTAVYTPTDEGVDVVLDRCRFADDAPVSGTGTIDAEGVVAFEAS